MNTTELAKETGHHYQAVSRVVRRLLAQDGTTARKGNIHFEFTAEFEQRVRDGLKNVEATKARRGQGIRFQKKKLKSTPEQRREWLAHWGPAFSQETNREHWVEFACVIASIEHSRFPGWLDTPTSLGPLGNRVIGMAMVAKADETAPGAYGGFTCWLAMNGFEP
jgi:hypothetical protein